MFQYLMSWNIAKILSGKPSCTCTSRGRLPSILSAQPSSCPGPITANYMQRQSLKNPVSSALVQLSCWHSRIRPASTPSFTSNFVHESSVISTWEGGSFKVEKSRIEYTLLVMFKWFGRGHWLVQCTSSMSLRIVRETGANPHRHEENMQTPHIEPRELNQGPAVLCHYTTSVGDFKVLKSILPIVRFIIEVYSFILFYPPKRKCSVKDRVTQKHCPE